MKQTVSNLKLAKVLFAIILSLENTGESYET